MEYKNFAYSRVVTAPTPSESGTSLVVTTGDGTLFPTTPFNVVVWPVGELPLITNAEIVTVTNKTGDTFTILRQQESTNARSITVGDRIAATITSYTARTFRFLNISKVTSTPYNVTETDDLIVCDSLNSIYINIPDAIGSGRVLNIKNINNGIVTVQGDVTNVIDGETSAIINSFENLQISDYDTGYWVII